MAAHIKASAFEIERLGPARFECDLCAGHERLADDTGRIVAYADVPTLRACVEAGEPLPSFEVAGRRGQLYFDPSRVKMGIVTCGGLCPGQNAVIRAVVLTAIYAYGVKQVLGFRYGYNGLSARPLAEPIVLDQPTVDLLHLHGGTLLASSRGAPNVPDMVDSLVRRGINILFTIGGDGTLRGAAAIAAEIRKRNLPIAVVGIPKTIDNDILWVDQSFGFRTAVEEAHRAIQAAHAEARGAWNGIGLVKLMGRHSGFVAAHACLANPDANFCLIPEVPFSLEGPRGFLEVLERRLAARQHAVVVVAEGAGQQLLDNPDPRAPRTDASGNLALKDIGVFLKQRIQEHLERRDMQATIKYIDPSYIVRSMPANASDSKLCLMLGQNAVHAAMAGRTNLVIGYWNQHFTHVPIELAVRARKQVQPDGDTWQAVLASTGQPPSMLSTG
jgi:6-phosphofructokinase 1